MTHTCDDCSAEHDLAVLAPIPVDDLSERGLTPGWPLPSGKCPTCGGLCFPARAVYVDPVFESLLTDTRGALAEFPPGPLADLHARLDALLLRYRADRHESLAWRTPELVED